MGWECDLPHECMTSQDATMTTITTNPIIAIRLVLLTKKGSVTIVWVTIRKPYYDISIVRDPVTSFLRQLPCGLLGVSCSHLIGQLTEQAITMRTPQEILIQVKLPTLLLQKFSQANVQSHIRMMTE